ncbi:MAG: hypothetical protein ABIJ57_02725 [Pseudomonadota bacterium]
MEWADLYEEYQDFPDDTDSLPVHNMITDWTKECLCGKNMKAVGPPIGSRSHNDIMRGTRRFS